MAYGFVQVILNIKRPFSFFGNPIFFGEFLAATLPIIVFLYLNERKNDFFYLFTIAGVLFFIFLTGSKGVMLSLFISLLFLFLKTRSFTDYRLQKNAIKIFLVLGLFLILIFLVPNILKLSIKNILSFSSIKFASSTSIKNRQVMASSVTKMIKANPIFGHGAGGVRYFYQKFQSKILSNNPKISFIKTSYAHNDYLQIMAEFGILGLVLFLLFVFSMFYFLDKNSHILNINEYIFSISLISGIIFILCESFFNFPLFVLPSATLFYIFLGVIYFTITKNNNFKTNNLFVFVFSLFVLFFVSLNFIKSIKPTIANFYSGKALAEGKNNSPMESIYYQKALEINKKDYTAAFNLAMTKFNTNDKINAIKYFMYSLSIYPYSADVLYNIATLKKSLGESKLSELYFKKTLELYPNSVLANLNLGKLYLDMNKIDKGLEYIAIAKQISPDYQDLEQLNKVIEFRETTYEILMK